MAELVGEGTRVTEEPGRRFGAEETSGHELASEWEGSREAMGSRSEGVWGLVW